MELFSTAYFGSIVYFKKIYQSHSPIIETKEHFIKQTIRTRCAILGANGKLQLSVPVKRINGNKTSIDEIIIDDQTPWRKQHWKSIESAYASSPYFEAYDLEIKNLILNKESNLITFNQEITNSIFQLLDLKKELLYTKEFQTENKANFLNFDFEKELEIPQYHQVFSDKSGFIGNLSILDLLFNEGPMARNWII